MLLTPPSRPPLLAPPPLCLQGQSARTMLNTTHKGTERVHTQAPVGVIQRKRVWDEDGIDFFWSHLKFSSWTLVFWLLTLHEEWCVGNEKELHGEKHLLIWDHCSQGRQDLYAHHVAYTLMITFYPNNRGGYVLPDSLENFISIAQLHVWLRGTNLITWFSYALT